MNINYIGSCHNWNVIAESLVVVAAIAIAIAVAVAVDVVVVQQYYHCIEMSVVCIHSYY